MATHCAFHQDIELITADQALPVASSSSAQGQSSSKKRRTSQPTFPCQGTSLDQLEHLPKSEDMNEGGTRTNADHDGGGARGGARGGNQRGGGKPNSHRRKPQRGGRGGGGAAQRLQENDRPPGAEEEPSGPRGRGGGRRGRGGGGGRGRRNPNPHQPSAESETPSQNDPESSEGPSNSTRGGSSRNHNNNRRSHNNNNADPRLQHRADVLSSLHSQGTRPRQYQGNESNDLGSDYRNGSHSGNPPEHQHSRGQYDESSNTYQGRNNTSRSNRRYNNQAYGNDRRGNNYDSSYDSYHQRRQDFYPTNGGTRNGADNFESDSYASYDKNASRQSRRGGGRHQPYYDGPTQAKGVHDDYSHDPSHQSSYIPPAAERQDSCDLGIREKLIQQLTEGSFECMVCLEMVRQKHAIWDCSMCYKVFHIHCLKKWSKTARDDSGNYQCPACRHPHSNLPREYRCFCRRVRDPEWNRRETPHSCGEVCAKKENRESFKNCQHSCTELCHPGPCPPCNANIKITCPCGQTSRFGRCGTVVACDNICGKTLNCASHTCPQICHDGPCEPCNENVFQSCFCGKSDRSLLCTEETGLITKYECHSQCDLELDCGRHRCEKLCHPDACTPCDKTVEKVKRCPCGQTDLEKIYERDGIEPRISCLDEIPTCGKTCDKLLECGESGKHHTCQALCHLGPCPACPSNTFVRCRCGFMEKELPCSDLKTRADDARCDKRCSKKRACGKHKCNQPCCIDIDHVCPLTCGKMLSCGTHRCEEPCHRSTTCPSCPNVSFEELYCYCGSQWIDPPVHCGTRPPVCTEPCSKRHPCNHPVTHQCNSDSQCPPCTVLMEKACYGKHEIRKSVPCHLEGLSCGRRCDADLPCERHKCPKPCHDGPCLPPAPQTNTDSRGVCCGQKCPVKRGACDHPCNAPCHEGPCPDTLCKEKIKVYCQCGHLTSSRTCGDQTTEFRRMELAQLMQSSASGSSYITPTSAKQLSTTGKIPCNEECSQLERNRRLALALQIENPDAGAKLTGPKYSEFLKDFARKDLSFAQNVQDKLSELVKLAKDSKQKSRSHSFECMNRDKRQFVHELSDHFGVESESYDNEPKRNVIATANRDRVWIPSQSIIDVVMKQKRAPGPVSLGASNRVLSSTSGLKTMSSLSSPKRSNLGAGLSYSSSNGSGATYSSAANTDSSSTSSSSKVIDYFDFDD